MQKADRKTKQDRKNIPWNTSQGGLGLKWQKIWAPESPSITFWTNSWQKSWGYGPGEGHPWVMEAGGLGKKSTFPLGTLLGNLVCLEQVWAWDWAIRTQATVSQLGCARCMWIMHSPIELQHPVGSYQPHSAPCTTCCSGSFAVRAGASSQWRAWTPAALCNSSEDGRSMEKPNM